jgi:hypothetical protein
LKNGSDVTTKKLGRELELFKFTADNLFPSAYPKMGAALRARLGPMCVAGRKSLPRPIRPTHPHPHGDEVARQALWQLGPGGGRAGGRGAL